MRLLIITQRVDINDDNLGFFHRWLEKFAEKVDKLYVVCLWKGEYDLPQNVEVYSMGKESGVSKLGQFFRLQKYLLKNLREVDGVFVHMSPIYVIASFPFTKLFGKKITMWYVHRSRNWKLWLAEKLVSHIFTTSNESFRIKSNKVNIHGHGIDTEIFSPNINKGNIVPFKIVYVARVSPIKDFETLVYAVDILVNSRKIEDFVIEIIGCPMTSSDFDYFKKIKALIERKGVEHKFVFLGGVPHREIAQYYQNSNLSINLCPTGGMDKAVIESMSCGVPVLVCNEAFGKALYKIYPGSLFDRGDYNDLALKIEKYMRLNNEERKQLGRKMREVVVKNHDLDNIVNKIIQSF